MAAVGKGPHFLQKNPPADFSGYGPAVTYQGTIASFTLITQSLQNAGLIFCEVFSFLSKQSLSDCCTPCSLPGTGFIGIKGFSCFQ